MRTAVPCTILTGTCVGLVSHVRGTCVERRGFAARFRHLSGTYSAPILGRKSPAQGHKNARWGPTCPHTSCFFHVLGASPGRPGTLPGFARVSLGKGHEFRHLSGTYVLSTTCALAPRPYTRAQELGNPKTRIANIVAQLALLSRVITQGTTSCLLRDSAEKHKKTSIDFHTNDEHSERHKLCSRRCAR